MLAQYLILSVILFAIGALGVMTKRNIIMVLLSIEIMLNATNLSFVTFSSFAQNLNGQIASIFVIAIAACEVSIGLAVAVLLFKRKGTVDTQAMDLMKW